MRGEGFFRGIPFCLFLRFFLGAIFDFLDVELQVRPSYIA